MFLFIPSLVESTPKITVLSQDVLRQYFHCLGLWTLCLGLYLVLVPLLAEICKKLAHCNKGA